jgi:hypothetical protein
MIENQPSCEVDFDRVTRRLTGVHFMNGGGQADKMLQAARERSERITRQLACPHGLTNRERRRLNKELQALSRVEYGGFKSEFPGDWPGVLCVKRDFVNTERFRYAYHLQKRGDAAAKRKLRKFYQKEASRLRILPISQSQSGSEFVLCS